MDASPDNSTTTPLPSLPPRPMSPFDVAPPVVKKAIVRQNLTQIPTDRVLRERRPVTGRKTEAELEVDDDGEAAVLPKKKAPVKRVDPTAKRPVPTKAPVAAPVGAPAANPTEVPAVPPTGGQASQLEVPPRARALAISAAIAASVKQKRSSRKQKAKAPKSRAASASKRKSQTDPDKESLSDSAPKAKKVKRARIAVQEELSGDDYDEFYGIGEKDEGGEDSEEDVPMPDLLANVRDMLGQSSSSEQAVALESLAELIQHNKTHSKPKVSTVFPASQEAQPTSYPSPYAVAFPRAQTNSSYPSNTPNSAGGYPAVGPRTTEAVAVPEEHNGVASGFQSMPNNRKSRLFDQNLCTPFGLFHTLTLRTR